MHKNESVDVHQFAMVPDSDIPRSSFRIQKGYKTTIDASKLVPFYLDEILPGDTFNVKATIFGRMATPIYPIMDNIYLETFFFFVPMRLVWDNWQKFMGEQKNPGDSIDFAIPQQVSPTGGYVANSLGDYFGLPTVGGLGAAATYSHSALPFRAYGLIWNEWFRDQNLQNSLVVATGDGPDLATGITLQSRGKRHDYFTSCLPWVQKGSSVTLPLGGQATVKASASRLLTGTQTAATTALAAGGGQSGANLSFSSGANGLSFGNHLTANLTGTYQPIAFTNLYADLTTATAATINQLRQSFQIQKLLERDARGGTRYTEIVRSHFGVMSPDARLQRPEYLGGGSSPINVSPVAQTSASAYVNPASAPLGELGAYATVTANDHGFTQSFTEHGYVIGMLNVRADLTYQQGVRKLWDRSTRYDFYFPVFAMLGEQSVLNKEIYAKGDANDDLTFGYQERWAEYRYNPSEITGYMKSTNATPLDGWHLAQEFATLPALNSTFITDAVPMDRVLAVGAAANGKHFVIDSFIDIKAARPLPMYSVPGMVDHF